MILDVGTLLTREKGRGALASVVSGTTASVLNAIGVLFLGLSAPVSAALFLYMFGSVLSYSLDVVFAKRDFMQRGSRVPAPLPYNAIGKRARWLMRSFTQRFFLRFLITVLLETLTGLALLRAAIRIMDHHGFLMDHRKIRDVCASVLTVVFVFVLFGNILRFDWAYKDVDQPLLTIVVLAWVAITLLVTALSVEYR